MGAGGDELVGDRDRVDEAGADRLEVEGGPRRDAEILLDHRRGGGKGVVRRRGGADDKVDVGGVNPASARAASQALTPSVEVNSSSAAIRRSSMPVRCTIHSCEVSTEADRSRLVTIRLGR
jgi:hypothetical protein